MTNNNKRKRYYYAKIAEQFINGSEINYLMSQGATGFKAVLLFQKLLIKKANDNGRLSVKFESKEIAYSPELIANDFGGFGVTTIRKSLKLLENCGLLKLEKDIYYIANFNNYIGSETGAAAEMRDIREAERKLAETIADEILSRATDLQRAHANKMASRMFDIGLIRNMTDAGPYELALNGVLGLIIEYGEQMTDRALEHVLNAATTRNADGMITGFMFNLTTNLSQIKYVLKSMQKRCEILRENDIKRGEY